MKEEKQKRIVSAPQSALGASSSPPANSVISVELSADEDVEWTWASMPDGSKYVSGYTIVKKAS
ncbi:MAG: hypothetical protein AAF215_15845 [Cyanobacteria bacterium P01_A01_bin.123]